VSKAERLLDDRGWLNDALIRVFLLLGTLHNACSQSSRVYDLEIQKFAHWIT